MVKVVVADGPESWLLVATTEQEYRVLGENPVTSSGPDWEGNKGREEEEGEQERV